MPATGRDRSFRAWHKDVTEGFVLRASQKEGDRDELVIAPRCVRGHQRRAAAAGLAAGSAES